MHEVRIAQEGLKIDWAMMPTYNTLMAVAVGAGLIGLVLLARQLLRDPKEISVDGWALAFGVLGSILTLTGAHMTLTWPLAAGGFAFDNIIFGETSLAFGVLLLASAFYLWRRGEAVVSSQDPVLEAVRVARPISIFIGGLGLSLFAIAIAGVRYQLFAAPPEEPISGAFAGYPLVEAIFVSGLIALVGVGAVLFPFALSTVGDRARRGGLVVRLIGWTWAVAGVLFGLFGAMNFFTHIGLIVNTM